MYCVVVFGLLSVSTARVRVDTLIRQESAVYSSNGTSSWTPASTPEIHNNDATLVANAYARRSHTLRHVRLDQRDVVSTWRRREVHRTSLISIH